MDSSNYVKNDLYLPLITDPSNEQGDFLGFGVQQVANKNFDCDPQVGPNNDQIIRSLGSSPTTSPTEAYQAADLPSPEEPVQTSVEIEKERKRQLRLEKNRISGQRSRDNKLRYKLALEKQVHELGISNLSLLDKNLGLSEENERLRAEINKLKNQL